VFYDKADRLVLSVIKVTLKPPASRQIDLVKSALKTWT
jgi:hypothetical protein